jgi:hypothetical protein
MLWCDRNYLSKIAAPERQLEFTHLPEFGQILFKKQFM